MTQNRCHKERRRLLDALEEFMRRTPLSHAQRDECERARRVFRGERGATKKSQQRIFLAAGDVATTMLEVISESAGTADSSN